MCPILTLGSFFRRARSTFLFICSTTPTDVQNILEMPEPRPKQKHRRPEPRKHTKDPPFVFSLSFSSALSDFFEFLDCTKGSPIHLFQYFPTHWMSKNPKGSPFYIIRHCDTVQKSHFQKLFQKFFEIPQGSPFIFFHTLQPTGVSQSPKGPHFYNFEPQI